MLAFSIFGGVIGFLIAVVIMRWVFSINKIVGLLEVIAQELRARNIADGINDKLEHSKENVNNLNHLFAWAYKEKTVEKQ